MIMKISASHLQTDSKKLVKAVKRGKTVVITYHGKTLAKVTPTTEHTGTDDRDRALTEFIEAFKTDEPQQNPAGVARKLRTGRRGRLNVI